MDPYPRGLQHCRNGFSGLFPDSENDFVGDGSGDPGAFQAVDASGKSASSKLTTSMVSRRGVGDALLVEYGQLCVASSCFWQVSTKCSCNKVGIGRR